MEVLCPKHLRLPSLRYPKLTAVRLRHNVLARCCAAGASEHNVKRVGLLMVKQLHAGMVTEHFTPLLDKIAMTAALDGSLAGFDGRLLMVDSCLACSNASTLLV